MKKLSILLCAVLIVVATVGLQAATIVTFFGEDINNSESVRLASHPNSSTAQTNFLANLVGVGTETFESLSGSVPLSLTFTGAGTATLQGNGTIVNIPCCGTNGFGRYPISGSKYLEADASSFYIDFSDPIAAFGFYGVDVGDFGGHLTLTLTSGGTTTLTVPNTVGSSGSTGGSVLYYGFYDTANTYTKITFGNSAGGTDVFAFDDMTIGSLEQVVPTNPIPEPGTLLLLGTGLVGVARFVRRKIAA